MNDAVVVDASVWVSWLRPQDINHNASILWMDRYISEGGELVVPEFLSIEVAAAITRRTGEPTLGTEGVRTLHAVSTIRFVPLDSNLVQAAIDLMLRGNHSTHCPLSP